jgi:hypothetical protein
VRQALRDAGLEAALESYEAVAREPPPEGVPRGEGVDPGESCAGLVIALFGRASPAGAAALLAGVLVKSAVRVDGNDSILLATSGTALQGAAMGDFKRIYNRWGYEFVAG